jgi:hypothetical protein
VEFEQAKFCAAGQQPTISNGGGLSLIELSNRATQFKPLRFPANGVVLSTCLISFFGGDLNMFEVLFKMTAVYSCPRGRGLALGPMVVPRS